MDPAGILECKIVFCEQSSLLLPVSKQGEYLKFMYCRSRLFSHPRSLQMCNQIDVAVVENLNFFLQLLQKVSVSVIDLQNWTIVLEVIQQ